MFLIYSIVYTLAFIVLSPRFLFDALFNGKYAAGFKQRLGFLPSFDSKGKRVVWLHCVSVGETNAARPLAIKLKESSPDISLVVSTTTRTGQKLAQTAFTGIADLVFYFPFDWKSTVRRSLKHIKPSVVLLMETEIWFNFIRESYHSGSRLAIVNGRLSEKSFNRYSKIKKSMKRVLGYLDMALMQENADATRLMSLGIRASKVRVTGNLKFDHSIEKVELDLTDAFKERFCGDHNRPLIIAASTHEPEERWILTAFCSAKNDGPNPHPRLLIVPRHPERFSKIAAMIEEFRNSHDCEWRDYNFVKRSDPQTENDKSVDVILLDTVGELRSVYPLADIVFVGGSLIPHGGQSILEPAAAGKAIVTGPYTHNFEAVVEAFLEKKALVQLPVAPDDFQVFERIYEVFIQLLGDENKRRELGNNALTALEAGRGATENTIKFLQPLLDQSVVRQKSYG